MEHRVESNFDFDWRFTLGDVAGAQAPRFNDTAWRKLDVPHDWSIEGKYAEDNPNFAVTAWLPTGIGWYRKRFAVTPEMLRKDVATLFDGVFMDSTTWINGVELGTEPYGYMSFQYDLSQYLHSGTNTMDPPVVSDRRWAIDSTVDPLERGSRTAGDGAMPKRNR